jgi:hypothetical protein
MTDPRNPERDPREDDAFVREIAAHYRPPEPTPSQRATFRAGLDARLARRRGTGWLPWAAGLATASAALAFVLLPGTLDTPGSSTGAPDGTTRLASGGATADTLLWLATPEAEGDEALPEEYEAIAGLFLEEV